MTKERLVELLKKYNENMARFMIRSKEKRMLENELEDNMNVRVTSAYRT